ncbi:restriction endonuclease [Chryseobacterium sp. OSA05B]|uniref:restriction endonuclease n=1 Tax=Chryseobacterium sp. OSA05B TaxID=2862650 RepID=UPI001CBB00EB|nr:restriction endonuclease [Chryseobacterium sp. OSA05B]
MIIDFADIPPSNKGGKYQDLFEQFACAFLEAKGFEIVQRPDRGPDGKKDLLVKEIQKGFSGTSETIWLVSCKHNAHSNKSVNDTDEPDISDRVKKFNCDGFIGFYSTIPSSGLSNKLHSLKNNSKGFNYIIYDNARISSELLTMNKSPAIIANFFPNSYDKYRQLNIQNKPPERTYNFEINLAVAKTALIILEIDEIEENFESKAINKKINLLNKLFKFYKHRNEEIAHSIFDFLYSVSQSVRSSESIKISEVIKSLVFTYFPSSQDYSSEKLVENGKNCVHLAYNLIYDAFIWIDNFQIAINGLLIWKYLYRFAKEHDIRELTKEIELYYQFLKDTLNRPERKDLVNAGRLVNIFKNDLDRSSMYYPDIPTDLYRIILKSKDGITAKFD